MIAAVTPAADIHPAATITGNTVPKCNITTAKEAPLFNRAELHFKSYHTEQREKCTSRQEHCG